MFSSTVLKTFSFLSLPPEIRNMIYSMVVISSEPIGVWTPRRREDCQPSQSWNLRKRCVWNRQTYREASYLYFSLNTFKFGIDEYRGDYWTPHTLSVWGRQCFVTETPACYLVRIKTMIVEIQPLERPKKVVKTCMGKMLERADELSIIARLLKKKFTGLEILHLQHAKKYPNGAPQKYHIPRNLEKTGATKFTEALLILRQHESLKVVFARLDYGFFEFEEQIKKRLLKKDPAATSLINFG